MTSLVDIDRLARNGQKLVANMEVLIAANERLRNAALDARAENERFRGLLRTIVQNRQACMEAGLPTTGSFVSAYQLDQIEAALSGQPARTGVPGSPEVEK